ncbi:unnamed protein product [Boreogadus saida]
MKEGVHVECGVEEQLWAGRFGKLVGLRRRSKSQTHRLVGWALGGDTCCADRAPDSWGTRRVPPGDTGHLKPDDSSGPRGVGRGHRGAGGPARSDRLGSGSEPDLVLVLDWDLVLNPTWFWFSIGIWFWAEERGSDGQTVCQGSDSQ